jgi:hypothetical protein
MRRPTRKLEARSRDNRFSRFTALIVGIVLTGATVAIAATAVNWSSVSEANLIYAGGTPQAPLFQVKIQENTHFFHVTTRPVFKNTGFKSGALERVNVVPIGLKHPAREIKVLHLDRSEIGWLETKEIRCEFVAVVDSAALDPQIPLEFRVHFYGPHDQEIYWEGITIENIHRPSSAARRPIDYVVNPQLGSRLATLPKRAAGDRGAVPNGPDRGREARSLWG